MKGSRLVLPVLVGGLLMAAAALVYAAEAGGGWLTSYPKALEQAKASQKMVLADFTGSDWCGFCIKLKKEVFDTPEFQKWAAEKFVLLELDYPQAKAQTDEVKKQNAALKEKYKIQGFPTVVFLDGSEKELGRVVGYGGKDTWMKQVKAIVDKH